MESANAFKIIVGLLLLSIVFQSFSLSRSFRSVALLSSDLFEMFRPLSYLYFLGGVLLAVAIITYYLAIDKISRVNIVLSLFIASLIMYKLLPKYVYYLPLQREIYHTANIMYVYDNHSIGVPGYPSMPDSVGYAIFYAVLGRVLGLSNQEFITFLAIFTDLFHLIIIELISLAVINKWSREPFRKWFLLILSIPVIFMLQINTTYRNGFASLLMIYIVATLCTARSEVIKDKRFILTLSPFLLASAVSYLGVIPLFTTSTLLYASIHVIDSLIHKKKPINVTWSLYSVIVANTAWFLWQLSRYPSAFIAINMYYNSLLELISGQVELEALTTRYYMYSHQYYTLLTLRTAYALTLIGLVGTLAIVSLFTTLKGYKKGNNNALIAASFATTLLSFILIGAKGNFHFAAIYNIFSSASAILVATFLFSNPFSEFLSRASTAKKWHWIKGSLQVFMIPAFCILTILSPVALWPAFKNLMPLEAREIHMFKTLAAFTKNEVSVGYLGLYGDVMDTAIQYVFANRSNMLVNGIPYPTESTYDYRIIVVARNTISVQSKVEFATPLDVWLEEYLAILSNNGYSKVVDLGDNYCILVKNSYW